MTRDECREYLPENWLPILEADPMLWEIFSEHEYGLEQEAVPPFLIQELRGGNLEHLRPLLSLYGEPGLELLEGLLEIDKAAEDTAELLLPDGGVEYAGYFFARFTKADQEKAVKTAKRYLRAICQVYEEVFREPSPVEPRGGVLLLTGQEARSMDEKIHQAFVHGYATSWGTGLRTCRIKGTAANWRPCSVKPFTISTTTIFSPTPCSGP